MKSLLYLCLLSNLIVFVLAVEHWTKPSKHGHLRHKFGTRRPIPVTDKMVVSLSEWAANQMHGKLVHVNTAKEQVVEGLLYYINFTMKDKHRKERVCFVTVWLRLWLHSTKLEHHHCV